MIDPVKDSQAIQEANVAAPDRSLDKALAELPEAGSDFLDFHLLSELGHGTFGRVYLAQQGGLANRLVALKIAANIFSEPQLLAQLQHTNIVPIYSVHRTGLLQAVCMPYFGPTTLADVLKDVERRSGRPTCGAALVSMLQATVLATPAAPAERPSPPTGNAGGLVRLLQTMSYVRAVLWIGVRLADGLAHAHDRGILHRDLKPANILLSDDGQPMLLDFNLSEDIKLRPQGRLAHLGGTLPYMAPEHLEAFRGGARPVDDRSDLYALGVILYELLAGRLPFAVPPGPPAEVLAAVLAERRQPPPALRPWNRDVTPAVEAIVQHCLEPDPDRRYQSAHELREDLQRQMEDLPLRYAPEPSLRERVRKWARRHRRLASPLSLGMTAALTLAAVVVPLAWYAWESADERSRHAEQRQEAARRDQEAADRANEAAKQQRLRADELKRQADRKGTALAALHNFRQEASELQGLESKLNPARLLLNKPELTPAELVEDAEQCRRTLARYGVLEDPDWQAGPLVAFLPYDEKDRLKEEVADVLCLLARTEAYRLAPRLKQLHLVNLACVLVPSHGGGLLACAAGGAPWLAERRLALEPLRRARECFPDGRLPQLLLAHCDLLNEFCGRGAGEALAEEWGLHAGAWAGGIRPVADLGPAPHAAELYWAGVREVAARHFAEAKPLLRATTQRAPQYAPAWFALGSCYAELKQYDKAVLYYGSCLALEPEFAWVRVSRGRLYMEKLRNWEAARNDFDQVIRQRPDWGPAYVDRAAALTLAGQYAQAIKDLDKALELKPTDVEIYFVRAELRKREGDLLGAEADRRKVIETEPATALGWTYRGIARAAQDPSAALWDFDTALHLDEKCLLALVNKADLLANRLNLPHKAVRLLDEVVAEQPDFQNAQFKRGLLLAREGRASRLRAHADAEALRQRAPTPERHYQAACIYAQSARWEPDDRRRAMELLKVAVQGGYGLERIQGGAPELAPLRDTVEFLALQRAIEFLNPGQAGTAPRR